MSQADQWREGCELLSVGEMMRADAFAVSAGVSVETLMEAAGKAVADAIVARFAPCRTVVLAGPGNNGGDGFVAARYLQQAGWPVHVALLGQKSALKAEAALNADRWSGETVPLGRDALAGCALIVDALFGAGLSRRLDGVAAEVVRALAGGGAPVVAVDVPSGVAGDTGDILGADQGGVAAPARLTVTFFRAKPGHLLLPGRELCGELVVADIGIPREAVTAIGPRQWRNAPELWAGRFPWPRPTDHKYSRGHLMVCGGGAMTGAARLAARAGQRAGAGLVTILAPPSAVATYASGDLWSVIVRPCETLADFHAGLEDVRLRALVIGPGSGTGGPTHAYVRAALEAGKACVLDADAITVFSTSDQGRDELFESIALGGGRCVMTPHEGEFARLFSGRDGWPGSKLERARRAAALSGAVVVLKGYDSVIAAPDGRAAINDNAPATLATAGAGDVLAGIIGGLLAQGMDPYEAACAGVWLHGAAAVAVGPGLIAEDLLDRLPAALAVLQNSPSR